MLNKNNSTEEDKGQAYPSIEKPWLKYYNNEDISASLIECTMYEQIYNNNQGNLDRIAMEYYGTKITYRSLFREISLTAGALENMGVKKGDVVTICMINSPESIYLLFALNKIGAVANMVCGTSTPEELKKHLLDVRSTIVFTLDIFQSKFAKIVEEVNLEQIVVISISQSMSWRNQIGARIFKGMKKVPILEDRRFVSWKEFCQGKKEGETLCHDADMPAVITYTGRTTGGSKGVILSNKAVVAVAQQYIIGEKEMKHESTWVQLLPLFIAYGVTCSLMVPLSFGMTMIIRIPMSESIADICKKFKPNHIIYGPAYWEAFADDNKELDLSNLIAPISGGDTLHAAAEKKINEYLKRNGSSYLLMNGYGMTEVGAAVSVNFNYAYEFGSVGIPFIKNVISAFDIETGEELTYGREGEICIQAPSMMCGYVNNQEETNNVIRMHKDGKLWVHSGDLGYITRDGFVHISGRLKRYMICIADGIQKKVFSLDIEKVLLKHSKVAGCVVVPMENKKTYQAPVAYIILKKEYKIDFDIENEIKTYGEKNLKGVYRPIRYIFVDKFPLTKIGKVDYLALEKSLKERKTNEQ